MSASMRHVEESLTGELVLLDPAVRASQQAIDELLHPDFPSVVSRAVGGAQRVAVDDGRHPDSGWWAPRSAIVRWSHTMQLHRFPATIIPNLSGVDDCDSPLRSHGEALNVISVRGHNGSATPNCRFDDRRVDSAHGPGDSSSERSRSLCSDVVEEFDLTSVEQSGKVWLTTSTPGLHNAARWNNWTDAALKGTCMQRPQSTIVTIGCDQHTSVVQHA